MHETPGDAFLASIPDLLPDAIIWVRPVMDTEGEVKDFEVGYANPAASEVVRHPRGHLAGLWILRDGVPSQPSAQANFHHFLDVYQTGTTKEHSFYAHHSGRQMETIRRPCEGGVLSFTRDREGQRAAERKEQEKTELLNGVVNNAPIGIFTCEAVRDESGTITDLRYTQVNDMFRQMAGRGGEAVVGRTMLELNPTVKTTVAFEAYCTVIETGAPCRFEMYYHGEGLDAWYDISVARVGTEGVVVTLADVTGTKNAFLEVERQKTLLDNLLQYSPSGISVLEAIRDEAGAVADFRNILINDRAAQFTGLPKEVLLARTNLQIDPRFADSPAYGVLVHTLHTGEPAYTDYRLEPTGRWIEGAVSKMDDNHLICIITDVTAARAIHQLAEESHEKLRTVVNTTQAGIFMGAPVLDEGGDITDFRFTMVNQVLANFAGKPPAELIGELGSRWFARYKDNGLFERFRDTYLSGHRQQFDFHYQGHQGEVWVNIMTARLGDELLGSFTDYTPVKRLQLQLESSVEELKRSNANLEEFAHAASHDLKEPIRKIHTFASRLKDQLAERMDESEKALFGRMESAAERMSQLVEDLLQYSQVSMGADQAQEVDLAGKLHAVLADLELPIEEKEAVITVGPLPVVRGFGRQLQQLLQNLVSNALKYSKPGVAPQVTISAHPVTGQDLPFETAEPQRTYHLIRVRDNGIGFEQHYAERIFQMFQRLHGRSEYPGTGIGLSIARKVAENHGGYITAESSPGEGATFNVFLPA